MSEIHIGSSDQVRLVGVALAASNWPEQEQTGLRHAVHPHAKATRQWVQPFSQQEAIGQLNEMLASGRSLAEVYARGLREVDWLVGFGQETAVAADFWPLHEEVWQTAVSELHHIIDTAKLASFLQRLVRHSQLPALQVHPNLLYPALTPVLAVTETSWHLLLPPPKAVGESPPWPYAEDPGWVVAQLCQALLPQMLGVGQDQTPLLHALTTVCLGELIDDFEAQAYLLRSKKQHKLPRLPQLVSQVEDYLAGKSEILFVGD